jgi:phosphate butyryltransferase
VAGDADILIVPSIEAGNMLYKSLMYLGNAKSAGLILGTRAPVILTSRADSSETKQASIALAVLAWLP